MISTMEDDEECITGLCLGLGTGGNTNNNNNNNNNVPKKEKQKVKKPIVANSLDLPFELCTDQEDHDESFDNKPEIIFSLHQRNDEEGHHHHHHHSPNSKSSEDDSTKSKNGIRKKLRLTKDQLAMLESSFKLHTTLNSAQKQALADKLNLKARQIEVWFQNRRARTKLKQTEVDCELLKRRCESLSDENRRLKKEVQELRALKVAKSPLYIQLSKAATLTTTCASCDKLVKPDPTIE